MFEVILSPEARAFFSAADPPLARKLARCFAHLERDPHRHNNIKRLSGKLAANYGIASAIGAPSIELMIGRVKSMCWSSRVEAKYTNDPLAG